MTTGQAIARLARIQHVNISAFEGLTVRQALLECGFDVKRWKVSASVLSTVYYINKPRERAEGFKVRWAGCLKRDY